MHNRGKMTRAIGNRQKKLLALVGASSVLAIVVGVALFSDATIDDRSATGTIGGALELDVADSRLAWLEFDGSEGMLTDVLEASVSFTSALAQQAVGFELFLSRDEKFDRHEDCLVQDRSIPVAAGQAATVRFRSVAFDAPCVDAGLWHAAVRVVDTGEWIPLEEVVEIAGGAADLELAGTARERGLNEPITVQVDIHREAGSAGLEGLLDYPATVWLKGDDRLCLVQTEGITVPRDPVRKLEGTWQSTRIEILVDPGRALKVDSDLELSELATRGQQDVRADGPCGFGEGEWQIALGPISPARFRALSVYVNGPPVRIDSDPIKVTLPEGEARAVEVSAVNAAHRAVTWSVSADGVNADTWLKGMSNQRLDGGTETDLLLTVSAVDLAPGFYTGEFRIVLDDYYRTEALVPVELTVQRSRGGARVDNLEQPGEFEISNYPNPFRGRTTIRVTLREAGQVRVAVYDVSGREVGLVADEWMSEGLHEIPFEADNLPSGTYLGRVTTESGVLTRTMTLVN